jgi:predicted DNA-binding protein
MQDQTKIDFRIPSEVAEKVKKIAWGRQTSVSHIVRDAIDKLIQESEIPEFIAYGCEDDDS